MTSIITYYYTVPLIESIKVKKRQVETNSSNKVAHQSSKEKGYPNNEHIRNTRNDSNKNMRKKITATADSMVTFLLSDEMSSVNNAVNVIKHPGSITDAMVDYIRPVFPKILML